MNCSKTAVHGRSRRPALESCGGVGRPAPETSSIIEFCAVEHQLPRSDLSVDNKREIQVAPGGLPYSHDKGHGYSEACVLQRGYANLRIKSIGSPNSAYDVIKNPSQCPHYSISRESKRRAHYSCVWNPPEAARRLSASLHGIWRPSLLTANTVRVRYLRLR
jgi:hypothetical protein